MNKVLKEAIEKLEKMSLEMGIDFYPMKYEVVSNDVMLEVMSYGLPTRARHWKYGQSYEYQKINGEMGGSKVYELVLNNNPCYAFLLDSNPDIINIMVSAHVLGHCYVFKNNYLFKKTDNKMVYKAAERAARVDSYIDKYGLDEVERVMDMAFSIERNIDWHKGVNRGKYQQKIILNKNKKVDQFADLNTNKNSNFDFNLKSFPPHPETDILWFLINYSNMEDWKKDIFDIIREESFYFYPQYKTKILNEGMACYAHTELMLKLDVSPSDFIEYSKLHERVVQPGGNKFNINPYYLGFKILSDIKKRWDEKHEAGESELTGHEKVLQVCKEEDDIGLLRNYLTQDLCNDMELFVYDQLQMPNGDKIIEIVSKKLDDVVEYLCKDLYNYRSPVLSIVSANSWGLEIDHESTEIGTLDASHIKKVMAYLYEIWGSPIDVKTVDENGTTIHLTIDEEGFSF